MVVYVKDNNSRCIKILIKNFKVKKKFFNETICQNINDKLTYFQQIFNFSGFPYLQVREVPTIIFGKRTGEIIDLLYSSETKRRLLGYNKKVPQLLIRYKEVNVTSLNLQGYNQLCNSWYFLRLENIIYVLTNIGEVCLPSRRRERSSSKRTERGWEPHSSSFLPLPSFGKEEGSFALSKDPHSMLLGAYIWKKHKFMLPCFILIFLIMLKTPLIPYLYLFLSFIEIYKCEIIRFIVYAYFLILYRLMLCGAFNIIKNWNTEYYYIFPFFIIQELTTFHTLQEQGKQFFEEALKVNIINLGVEYFPIMWVKAFIPKNIIEGPRMGTPLVRAKLFMKREGARTFLNYYSKSKGVGFEESSISSGLINNKFYEWFVGYTDGDGCFNVYTNKKLKQIIFTFKLSQKKNNIQVLYYIKKKLGVGSVKIYGNMADYIIRDKKSIEKVLLPIFNNIPLLTIKEFKYHIFLEAFQISLNNKLSQKEKIEKIEKIKEKKMPNNYVANYWHSVSIMSNIKEEEARGLPKFWLIGFIEAEGSFYIVKKDKNRLCHGFGLTQKYDNIILEQIRKMFNIKAKVKYNKKGFYSLDTTNKKSLKNIKIYFNNQFKSRKSLDYKIWAKSLKYNGKYLIKVKNLLRKIRIT